MCHTSDENFLTPNFSQTTVIYVHMFSHRQLYTAFPAGLNTGELDNSKIGSLDGSSGSYLQNKLFGYDPDS